MNLQSFPRNIQFISIILIAGISLFALHGCGKNETLHEISVDDFSYSKNVEAALAELKKRGGLWELEKGHVSLTHTLASIYGKESKVKNLKEGKDIKINSAGIALKRIKPGTFTMGSPADEEFRKRSEFQKKVQLTKGFYIGVTEITVRQYLTVLGKGSVSTLFKREHLDSPINFISWDDANKFCKALSAIEGKTYRLPTEAEWEYACRAGSTGPFSFEGEGDGDCLKAKAPCYARESAWYDEDNPLTDGFAYPVALKKPNAWGLYDMHGNVAEFVLDVLTLKPTENDLVDPIGKLDSKTKRARGGRFRDSIVNCRSASRGHSLGPSSEGLGVGFRVVLEE